jgi:hypothetical protein
LEPERPSFPGLRFSLRRLMVAVAIAAVYNAVFALLSRDLRVDEGATVPEGKTLALAVVWNVVVMIPFAMVLMVRGLTGRALHQPGPELESWRSRPRPRWFLKLTLTALLGLVVDFALLSVLGHRLVPSIVGVDHLCVRILLCSHTWIVLSLALSGMCAG